MHLDPIVQQCGDLGPHVVHKVLGQPPMLVKEQNEGGQQQHDGKERQRQQECGGVEEEALHRGCNVC